jgi:hypothetical protein
MSSPVRPSTTSPVRPAFTRFLDDGRICLTNNAAERALRGAAGALVRATKGRCRARVGSVDSSAKMRSPMRMWCKTRSASGSRWNPIPAHPAGHQIAGELDLLAAIDRLLAIERQAVGVLRDGDLGQEPLGRNPRLSTAASAMPERSMIRRSTPL